MYPAPDGAPVHAGQAAPSTYHNTAALRAVPCPPPVSMALPALVCPDHPELACKDSKKVLHDCQSIARDAGLRSWLHVLQKIQTCFPEDEVRQAQTIVAKRRRELAKQPSGTEKVLTPSLL